MPAHDPIERRFRSTIASSKRWKDCPDRSAATQPARDALRAKFERQVDPDGTLAPEERARRAESARKLFFAELGLKSHQARRARELADRLTAEVEADLLGGAA